MQQMMTYTQAVKRLEEIVKLIDSNQLEIDQMVEKIEEANRLIAFCNEKLTKADQEIEKLWAKGLQSEE